MSFSSNQVSFLNLFRISPRGEAVNYRPYMRRYLSFKVAKLRKINDISVICILHFHLLVESPIYFSNPFIIRFDISIGQVVKKINIRHYISRCDCMSPDNNNNNNIFNKAPLLGGTIQMSCTNKM